MCRGAEQQKRLRRGAPRVVPSTFPRPVAGAALARNERRVRGSLDECSVGPERQVGRERRVLRSRRTIVGCHLHAPGAHKTCRPEILPMCTRNSGLRESEDHRCCHGARDAPAIESTGFHDFLPNGSVVGPPPPVGRPCAVSCERASLPTMERRCSRSGVFLKRP